MNLFQIVHETKRLRRTRGDTFGQWTIKRVSVFLGLCFSSFFKFLKSSSHPEFERNARKSLTSPTALTLSHVQRNTKKTTEKIRSLTYYAAFCTSSTWPHMGHRHTRLRISGRQLISKLWLVFRGGLNKHTRIHTHVHVSAPEGSTR